MGRWLVRATVAVLLGWLAACAGPSDDVLYERAVVDAAVKRPDRIYELTPIQTDEVTMVSWAGPYSPINKEAAEIRTGSSDWTWVTIARQMQAACSGFDAPGRTRRIEQLLGLPPGYGERRRMVTFKVRRDFLVRPCLDPSTTTGTCSTQADLTSSDPAQSDKVDKHGRWLAAHMLASFRADTPGQPGFPFTALGYTYDWNPENPLHMGLSEYVVRPGSTITDVKPADTAAFCRRP